MTDITVIILTKNEEKNIRKCIESFKGCAKRFVVVDCFSTDKTEEVCGQLNDALTKTGSRVDFYQHEWINHAAQINWAIENTDITTEWTMRMDADEELLPELVEEIEEKLPNLSVPINGVALRRRIIFMGRWIKHGGVYPQMLLRIFRTGTAFCEQRKMDEHIVLKEGTITSFSKDFYDNNLNNLEWWTNKHNGYSNLEMQDYFDRMSGIEDNSIDEKNGSVSNARRKRAIKNLGYYRLPKFFRAHLYFVYRYYLRFGFLDGKEGRVFHFLQAYWYRFLVDAKILENEKKKL